MSPHLKRAERANKHADRTQETLIITGSSGLIGSAFIDRVGPHYLEIGLDREGPPHPPPETEIVISCDVASDDSLRETFAELRRLGRPRIASVVHLAAYYDFSADPHRAIFELPLAEKLQDLRRKDFVTKQEIQIAFIQVPPRGGHVASNQRVRHAGCRFIRHVKISQFLQLRPERRTSIAEREFHGSITSRSR